MNRQRVIGLVAVGLAGALLVALGPAAAGTRGTDEQATSGQPNPWLDRRVISIAHAGGENEDPRETPFAFAEALRKGATVLELNVQLAADGTLVVMHSDTVDSTTNGHGRVDALTYPQLHALDHAYKFVPGKVSCEHCPKGDYLYRGIRTGHRAAPPGYTPDDFTITTARAMFERYPKTYLDIEIKRSGEAARAAARSLASLIREFHRTDRTVVVSFDDAIIGYFKTLSPDVATSPGTQGVAHFYADRKPQPGYRILQVPPTYSALTLVTPQFVRDAHAAGLAVWVWADTDAQDRYAFYRKLIGMGVDGLLGSRPTDAARVIADTGTAWNGLDRIPHPPAAGRTCGACVWSGPVHRLTSRTATFAARAADAWHPRSGVGVLDAPTMKGRRDGACEGSDGAAAAT